MMVHFPNLDGLRFVAAALVVVAHVEEVKHTLGVPGHWGPLVKGLGPAGVMLFFVLSGFLITWLLLAEKQQTGDVALGRFYMRRILRIWPLYFFVVLTGFFVLPHLGWLPAIGAWPSGDFWAQLLLFVVLLPHVALATYPAVPYVAPAWSIGVEEHFYLLWPWLVKGARDVTLAIVAFLGVFVAAKLAARLLLPRVLPPAELPAIWEFIGLFRLDGMAIGALGASLLYAEHARLRRVLIGVPAQLAALAAVPVLYVWGNVPGGPVVPWYMVPLVQLVLPAAFCVLIANMALAERSLVRLTHPLIACLGRISFGIYLFHGFAIGSAVALLGALGVALTGPLLHAATFALAIALAAASFRWLERPILALKRGFTVVETRESHELVGAEPRWARALQLVATERASPAAPPAGT